MREPLHHALLRLELSGGIRSRHGHARLDNRNVFIPGIGANLKEKCHHRALRCRRTRTAFVGLVHCRHTGSSREIYIDGSVVPPIYLRQEVLHVGIIEDGHEFGLHCSLIHGGVRAWTVAGSDPRASKYRVSVELISTVNGGVGSRLRPLDPALSALRQIRVNGAKAQLDINQTVVCSRVWHSLRVHFTTSKTFLTRFFVARFDNAENCARRLGHRQVVVTFHRVAPG